MIGWIGRRPWASSAIAIVGLVVAFFMQIALRTPRLDRDWDEHLAVMPAVGLDKADFSLNPVMDWSYTKDGPAEKGSTTFAASYADLKNVWFMVEPQPGQPYAAHTLVLFEFADDRMVGLTIEARLEKNETYDAIRGLFNEYELSFIWSTPKELLTRRAVFLSKDIYVYPLKLSDEQKQAFLRALLDRTVDIEKHPAFYNTFTSNCTNELAKVAKLDWHYSWILTGYSPQRLFDLKYIPGQDFDAARNLATIAPELRSWNALPSDVFARALLLELRRRYGS